jgi:cell division protease FtsH
MANQDPQNNNGYSWKKILGGLGAAGVLTFLFTMSQNNWELPFGKTDPVLSGDDSAQMIIEDSNIQGKERVGEKVHGVTWSKFNEMLDAGSITDALVSNSETNPEILFKEGQSTVRRVVPPKNFDVTTLLEKHKVHQENFNQPPQKAGGAKSDSSWGWLTSPTAMMFLPTLLFIGYLAWARHSDRKGNNPMGGFGKSKAKMNMEKDCKVRFDNVEGADDAKLELKEAVDFMMKSDKIAKLGGEMPKGILMVGPPGTGKTLLARAVAGEAKVPFFSTSGSDFMEMFVGVGASRARDMFEDAKKNAPCIIFIDEIDAIGRQRSSGGLGAGQDEREQTLNQLLVEMDGFEKNPGILMIAATNRPDILDSALLRSGRFDRQVTVGLPDVKGREKILALHIKEKEVPVADDLRLDVIAKRTQGMSGADLKNLVNEAAILAGRKDLEKVPHQMFEDAIARIQMGPERKNLMDAREKQKTSYHEIGHAILGAEGHTDNRVHKVTIMPRGQALGLTMFLDEKEIVSKSKHELKAMMATLMAGRVAEQLIFGEDEVTTGASNDIERATNIATNMVMKLGMSEKLGTLNYEQSSTSAMFQGKAGNDVPLSAELTNQIVKEIRALVDEAEETARKTLIEKIDVLHDLSQKLYEVETIDGEFVYDSLGIQAPADRPKDNIVPWENREDVYKNILSSSQNIAA